MHRPFLYARPAPSIQERSWKQQLVIDNLWSLAVVGELVVLVLHYNAATLLTSQITRTIASFPGPAQLSVTPWL